MNISTIVQRVNSYLAGENLPYDELIIHLDCVIDDINNKLNSTFPAFSEFTAVAYPVVATPGAYIYPNYSFFPEKYIRNVVCLGAAFKFYMTDEEGAEVAIKFEMEYIKALFHMERDYMNGVPVAFQAVDQGYVMTPENLANVLVIDEDNLHPTYYLNGDPL